MSHPTLDPIRELARVVAEDPDHWTSICATRLGPPGRAAFHLLAERHDAVGHEFATEIAELRKFYDSPSSSGLGESSVDRDRSLQTLLAMLRRYARGALYGEPPKHKTHRLANMLNELSELTHRNPGFVKMLTEDRESDKLRKGYVLYCKSWQEHADDDVSRYGIDAILRHLIPAAQRGALSTAEIEVMHWLVTNDDVDFSHRTKAAVILAHCSRRGEHDTPLLEFVKHLPDAYPAYERDAETPIDSHVVPLDFPPRLDRERSELPLLPFFDNLRHSHPHVASTSAALLTQFVTPETGYVVFRNLVEWLQGQHATVVAGDIAPVSRTAAYVLEYAAGILVTAQIQPEYERALRSIREWAKHDPDVTDALLDTSARLLEYPKLTHARHVTYETTIPLLRDTLPPSNTTHIPNLSYLPWQHGYRAT